MLWLLVACTSPKDLDSGGADTSDTGDTQETGDTVDTGETDTNETSETDTGETGDTGDTGDTGHGGYVGAYTLDDADVLWTGEGANDLVGHDLQRAGDPDGDGLDGLWIASAWNDGSASNAGIVYLVTTTSAGTYSLADATAAILGEAADDMTGGSMDGDADLDGDGAPDLVVGASGSDRGGVDQGAVFVLHAPFTGRDSVARSDSWIVGDTAGARIGNAVALLPRDDGPARLAVASDEADDSAPDAGVVYLYDAPAPGPTAAHLADAILLGEAADDNAGYAIGRAGDVDGDGQGDLLVGARGNDAGGVDAGRAYVVLLPVAGVLDLSTADLVLTGEAAGDNAGFQVADAGDVDGDGYGDVYVAAPNNDVAGENAGAAYLVRGNQTGERGLGAADGRYLGLNGFAGTSVASAGDTNGDGTPDLLVGARDYASGATSTGGAWLLTQPRRGTMSLADADAVFVGMSDGDACGDRATGAGDLNGDGRADLAITCDQADAGGRNSGEVAVYVAGGA